MVKIVNSDAVDEPANLKLFDEKSEAKPLDKTSNDHVRDELARSQGILDDLEDLDFDIRAKLSVADAALNLNNAISRIDYLMRKERNEL